MSRLNMKTLVREPILSPKDEKNFNAQMRRSYKKVFNLAYRLSGNRADAEDLTQEAFYRAYRSYRTYEGDKPFENWIFRIVTRLFLDLNRSRKRRVKTVSYDAPLRPDGADDTVLFDTSGEEPNPEEVFVGNTVSEEMEHSLSQLTSDQQKLVWLADVEGVPYNEIAAIFEAPVGTIRSRLHRAHKQLRQLLEKFRTERAALGTS
ncbi:MAG TPA: sigma-70 family RNA polymerase sigma factor [Fimbriimonadaceae bacterium]|nr:sigma-70 family RNA polymerase sigma factor [Fimbriimonadaceae bacterium]